MPDSTDVFLLTLALLAVAAVATSSDRIPERLKIPLSVAMIVLGALLALHAGLAPRALPDHFA